MNNACQPHLVVVASLTIALALIASACAGDSRPTTEQYMDVVRERIVEQSGALSDEIDKYGSPIGSNIVWDYLDSTGDRTMAMAAIITISCIDLFETRNPNHTLEALEGELGDSLRTEDDQLALFFLSIHVTDTLCADYETHRTDG